MINQIQNKVCSITVTYNPNLVVLKRQVLSLLTQVENLIVVDNDSENIENIERELKEIKSLKIIKLDENMGIAFAQNKGIEIAKSLGCSHIVLFDHDSEIPACFIDNLLRSESELLLRGENVAAVGPSFYNPNSNKPYPVPYLKKVSFLSGLFIQRKYFSEGDYIESYFLIASGCLIRTSVIDDVGVMDSDLFIDNVDQEWCLRAQIKGYKVFTSKKTSMSHIIGDKTRIFFGRQISVHSNMRKYYNTRNNLYLIKYKGIPIGLKLRVVPYLFIRFLVGILDTKNIKEYLRLYYWAIYDFAFNKKGKFNH
ncbi:glycosyltransferase family 2 protein [Aeromonas veronii]